ncbi:hypothetical protein HPB48_005753 [Haemaphysalis longicornis]|uniref:Uncharacterized protein n=1 Tax=Haemaphysalis longicornis TaxID=44386 RepID=A0A9J6GYM9_HAELO|nr:hypothetical protein HPB48_005753 [Haemaphysalis longicornis]
MLKLVQADENEVIPLWELFKREVKMHAIETACAKRQVEKMKEKELQCQLNFLLTTNAAQCNERTEAIRELKRQLELIDHERRHGALIQARTEKLWLGEATTKRALGETKKYATQNEIKTVRYAGDVTEDRETIQRAFQEYYDELLGRPKHIKDGFKRVSSIDAHP